MGFDTIEINLVVNVKIGFDLYRDAIAVQIELE